MIKTYDVERPESILDLGYAVLEQISLLGKVQKCCVKTMLYDSGNKFVYVNRS